MFHISSINHLHYSFEDHPLWKDLPLNRYVQVHYDGPEKHAVVHPLIWSKNFAVLTLAVLGNSVWQIIHKQNRFIKHGSLLKTLNHLCRNSVGNPKVEQNERKTLSFMKSSSFASKISCFCPSKVPTWELAAQHFILSLFHFHPYTSILYPLTQNKSLEHQKELQPTLFFLFFFFFVFFFLRKEKCSLPAIHQIIFRIT